MGAAEARAAENSNGFLAQRGRKTTDIRRNKGSMSNPTLTLTRRDMARLLLAGTASALLMTPNTSAFAETDPPATPKIDEGAALADAVPGAAGYVPTAAQAREAMAALKGYPGGFDKARAFPLANDVEPAWVSYAPLLTIKKKAARK